VQDLRGRGVALGGGGTVVVIALAAVVWCMGGDPLAVLQVASDAGAMQASRPSSGTDDALAEFVSVVLADTERTWSRLLPGYREPTLVLFEGQVASACGYQSAAVGPFYCPADEKAYIDLSFYRTLRDRLGAPGDFAQAYVLAHEVGHHVQHLTGISQRVRAQQQRDPRRANAWSVQQELQADCFAGVWAHHASEWLEPGDLEEGLRAAAAIGDDKLSGGRIRPDQFTHGTSAQRMEALRTGMRTGDPDACRIEGL
jgi:predicted metalloprotease